jgi:N-acetylglucosaminyl-diphospho-decaprenol L-rhamnosyltransferase
VHHEGQSSAQVPARKHLAFQQSKLLYVREAHGSASALLLRAVLLAGYALEWLVEALKWLLGHRRPLRSQRMRVYRAVLAALTRGERRGARGE